MSPQGHLPAFERLGPTGARTPLVIAVPHAGQYYPPAIERDRAVSRAVIEQLEDRHVDRLIGPVLAGGAVCIVARVARAWIDLNRAETDIPGAAGGESARSRAGLGLIPLRLGGRPLWRRNPEPCELAERIATVHRPYHAAIARALVEAQAAHGFAVLVDCHSMPPLVRGTPPAQLVIGDRHGVSAGIAVIQAALAAAAAARLPMARNAPYAGAHTLEFHARPDRDVHALQIEVDRSLYLKGAEPSVDGVARMAALVAAIAWAAVAAAGENVCAIAAE